MSKSLTPRNFSHRRCHLLLCSLLGVVPVRGLVLFNFLDILLLRSFWGKFLLCHFTPGVVLSLALE